MKIFNVNIKVLEGGRKPFKVRPVDACYDIYAREVNHIREDLVEVKLGVAMTPPPGHRIAIYPRSSISKTGWVLANSVGVGDETYTGEYKAYFSLVSNTPFPYSVGDRCCQMEVVEYNQINFIEVDHLEVTDRGNGGFGSTGK